ncbi:DUF4097 family beta strand repeat-containing protein [Palaeococcus ferrophilus]|uniref:hypothetical protein n=1 Tax=Palaeococcus ferrophilus TaxID=83868 RepID=UPI00064E8EE1|nr:hypothetical protein [Palaeococcus ferrophilus]
MRFEGVEEVWMKLVDVDLRVAGWEKDYVELNPGTERAIKLDFKDGELRVDYKAIWKLKKALKRDRTLEPLELRVPRGLPVSVAIKRGRVYAERVHFKSLTPGECTAELRECIIGELLSLASTVKGSISILEAASVKVLAGTASLRLGRIEGSFEGTAMSGMLEICIPEDGDVSLNIEQNGGVVTLEGVEDGLFEDGKHSLRLVAHNGGVVKVRLCEGDGHDA